MISRAKIVAAFVFTLSSIYAVRRSAASEDRVAVVGAAPNVTKAIAVALSPWGLHVVSVNGSISTRDVAAATAAARALASEEDAGAVVWLGTGEDARVSLWMYDSDTEAVAVRPLTQPRPFDDAAAAAVALSVKTLLRTTAMAPPRERAIAAPPASSPSAFESSSAPATSASSQAPALPAPSSSSALPAPSAVTAPRVDRSPTATSRPPPAWRIEALARGRVPTGAHASIALEGGLGVSFWPSLFGGRRLGAGLDFLAGPSLDVTGPLFAGTFSDTSFGATARARLDRAPFAIEIDARPALHLTSLSGTSLATARTLSIKRGDLSLGASLVPEIALGRRFAVGASLGVDAFTRTQLYVLGNDVVLRVPPFVFDFGGRVSLALD